MDYLSQADQKLIAYYASLDPDQQATQGSLVLLALEAVEAIRQPTSSPAIAAAPHAPAKPGK